MALSTAVLFLFAVVCSSFLGSFAIDPHDIPDKYDFQLNLQFNQSSAATFKFFYTYDKTNQMLKMAVKVLSLGWVGIGFSRNQGMPDSDVVIGWVDNSGKPFLQVSCSIFKQPAAATRTSWLYCFVRRRKLLAALAGCFVMPCM